LAEDNSFLEKVKISSGETPGWVVFIITLLIAFVLWFFLSLDENYKTDLNIRLKYINHPDNRILSFPLPETLSLSIKAKGLEIIRLKRWAKTNVIIIDLNNYKDKIVFSDFRIRNLLPEKLDKISVISISPANVGLNYDNIFSKKVKVISKVKYSCKSDYCALDEPLVQPAEIEVFGPEKEIRKITSVYTVDTQFNDLNNTLNTIVKLVKPVNPNIRLSTSHVNIIIPVEQLTEGSISLFINIPSELKNKITLIPPKVEITYQTILSKFSSIGTSDFYPTFSASDINNAKSAKIKITVGFDSTKIKNIRYFPEIVGFILK